MTSYASTRLTLIAALDRQGVIGANGGMPWHLPDDLKWFKRQTRDKPILMGRRTFESIGRALPRRTNLVLSRSSTLDGRDDIQRVESLAAALAHVGPVPELMIIGGAQLYTLALPQATRMLLTHIEAEYDGDTYFPAFDRREWEETERIEVSAEGGVPAHRFVTWQRSGG